MTEQLTMNTDTTPYGLYGTFDYWMTLYNECSDRRIKDDVSCLKGRDPRDCERMMVPAALSVLAAREAAYQAGNGDYTSGRAEYITFLESYQTEHGLSAPAQGETEMTATTYRAFAEIEYIAPWALDPSVSTKGHESGPRSGKLTSAADLDAWLTTNVPEITDHTPKERTLIDHGDGDRTYFLGGRDARGYRISVYVMVYGDTPVQEEEPAYVCPQPGCHAEAWTEAEVSDHLSNEHSFGRGTANAAARVLFATIAQEEEESYVQPLYAFSDDQTVCLHAREGDPEAIAELAMREARENASYAGRECACGILLNDDEKPSGVCTPCATGTLGTLDWKGDPMTTDTCEYTTATRDAAFPCFDVLHNGRNVGMISQPCGGYWNAYDEAGQLTGPTYQTYIEAVMQVADAYEAHNAELEEDTAVTGPSRSWSCAECDHPFSVFEADNLSGNGPRCPMCSSGELDPCTEPEEEETYEYHGTALCLHCDRPYDELLPTCPHCGMPTDDDATILARISDHDPADTSAELAQHHHDGQLWATYNPDKARALLESESGFFVCPSCRWMHDIRTCTCINCGEISCIPEDGTISPERRTWLDGIADGLEHGTTGLRPRMEALEEGCDYCTDLGSIIPDKTCFNCGAPIRHTPEADTRFPLDAPVRSFSDLDIEQHNTADEWIPGKGAELVYDAETWDRIFVALGDTMERRVLQYSTDIAWRGAVGTFTVKVTDPKLYAAIQAIAS